MPHIIVNATADGLDYDAGALARARAALPAHAPVVILIHGFKYAPGTPGRCPHRSILAEGAPRSHWKVAAWPRHLGFGPSEALVIAFGWTGTGTIWQAYHRAGSAGRALADFMDGLDRPSHILAHSLGARVALSALSDAAPGSVGRIILLAGTELRSVARAAMASPAGRVADVLNVTSAENTAFDLMLEAVLGCRGRSIGAGMGEVSGWVDLPVDRAATRARLARLGHPIAAPTRRICHWSLYLRPGLLPFYGAVIRGRVPVARLAAPLPVRESLLPFASRAAS